MHQENVTYVIIDKEFKYQPYLDSGFHDLMPKIMYFNDAAIISIKGNDYRIDFLYINKHDAINIMKNSNLNEKTGRL